MPWRSSGNRTSPEQSLIVGGTQGTGASPEHGQCELEGRAGATLKDLSRLFATVARAVEAVMKVKTAAVGHMHNELFMEPLHKLAAIFDRVQAALLGLQKIFADSAAAHRELGESPTRSTVNLRHFTICATVTLPPPLRVWLAARALPLRARDPSTHHPNLANAYLSIYVAQCVLCVLCVGRCGARDRPPCILDTANWVLPFLEGSPGESRGGRPPA